MIDRQLRELYESLYKDSTYYELDEKEATEYRLHIEAEIINRVGDLIRAEQENEIQLSDRTQWTNADKKHG